MRQAKDNCVDMQSCRWRLEQPLYPLPSRNSQMPSSNSQTGRKEKERPA